MDVKIIALALIETRKKVWIQIDRVDHSRSIHFADFVVRS